MSEIPKVFANPFEEQAVLGNWVLTLAIQVPRLRSKK
jgi:hypothetical protein